VRLIEEMSDCGCDADDGDYLSVSAIKLEFARHLVRDTELAAPYAHQVATHCTLQQCNINGMRSKTVMQFIFFSGSVAPYVSKNIYNGA